MVLAANPQVFVLENVERFSKTVEFSLLDGGVDIRPTSPVEVARGQVLNAADFGVPQRRHRTIVIASRVGADIASCADSLEGWHRRSSAVDHGGIRN